MPELPEVETIRRQLEPKVSGRTIAEAAVLDPLWCAPLPAVELEQALRGRLIEGLGRRGKYLLMALEDDFFLVMHLRMTGNLLWAPARLGEREPPYLRFRLVLDAGDRVLFTDLRRFGTGIVLEGGEALEAYLGSRLGPEPLEESFTPELLGRQAARRKAPVKAFLLDQTRVAGIGNIYADEALFRATIHPLKPAAWLRREEVERLHAAIIETLREGIESFGASIDRYRDSNGTPGEMQDRFLVHRRAGEPCPRCGATIAKLRAAGRGTYVCPACQRAPRSGVRRRKAKA